METLPAPDFFGNAIFCDDIRLEADGKLTFVGCYLGEIYVTDSFPVVLPRLCVAVNYWQKQTDLIFPVVFWIFLPGDSEEKASIEFGTTEEMNYDFLEQKRKEAVDRGAQEKYATFHTQIALTNLTVPQPGQIKVRVRRGDKLLRVGSIKIASAPQPIQQPAQAPPSFSPSP
jgi:hypothetical protein